MAEKGGGSEERPIFGGGGLAAQLAEPTERVEEASAEETGLAALLSDDAGDAGDVTEAPDDTKDGSEGSRRVQQRITRLAKQRTEQANRADAAERRATEAATRASTLEAQLARHDATERVLKTLYSESDDPLADLAFDHRLGGVLDKAFQGGTPEERAAIAVVAKLVEKGGVKMDDRTQQRTEQQLKVPGTAGATEQTASAEDSWAVNRLATQDINAVLKAERVKPELHKTLIDALLPKVIAAQGKAGADQIETWVAEHAKSQGWNLAFLVESGKARQDPPPTLGRRGVAGSSTPTDTSQADGGAKPMKAEDVKTTADGDAYRRSRWDQAARQIAARNQQT